MVQGWVVFGRRSAVRRESDTVVPHLVPCNGPLVRRGRLFTGRVSNVRGFFLAVLIIPLAGGCSNSSRTYEVEKVIGVEEQARDEVENAPLAFQVSHEEEQDSWERAQFFFANYSESKFTEGKNYLSTLPGQTVRFTYRVSKATVSGGKLITVECRDNGAVTTDSTFNAKNLARFIKEGTLEMSLMRR